jgi:hypothetical protein
VALELAVEESVESAVESGSVVELVERTMFLRKVGNYYVYSHHEHRTSAHHLDRSHSTHHFAT